MRLPIIFLSLTISLLSTCSPQKLRFEEAICIENISTIDPEAGLKEHQTLIIQDGKIIKIVPSEELQLDPQNEIIDGTGKFLIPGLWDAHVHFSYIEDLAPRMFDLFMAYGITSLRDTGGKIDFVRKWKEASLANPTEIPRLMIAGPLLDGLPNVYDGSAPSRPPLSVGLGTVEDVVSQISLLDSIGVDLLKAYEMLSPEQFQTVTRLAKEKKLKVTGHVPLSMDVISASNAGLNSMEHLRNLELSCAANAEELLSQRQTLLRQGRNDPGGILRSRIHQAQRETAIQNYDEAQAEKVLSVLAKNQTWQIPTLALSTGFVARPYLRPDFQTSFAYLPDSIQRQWIQNIEAFKARPVTQFNQDYTAWILEIVKKIHEAEIGIMAGTDCPIFFLTPGRSLHEELAVLVKAGLSPLEALKTATLNPAKYFNLEGELGAIQENMLADLIILDANPLDDINNTLRINGVIKQGNYFDRAKLDQLLSTLEEQ